MQRPAGVDCRDGLEQHQGGLWPHSVNKREAGDKPQARSIEAKVGSFVLVSVRQDVNREVGVED